MNYQKAYEASQSSDPHVHHAQLLATNSEYFKITEQENESQIDMTFKNTNRKQKRVQIEENVRTKKQRKTRRGINHDKETQRDIRFIQ